MEGLLASTVLSSRWFNISSPPQIIFEQSNHDDNQINICDLRETFKSCGYQLNNHILCLIFHRYGSSDYKIAFEDFIMCAVKLRTIIEKFRAKAKEKDEATFSLHEWITLVLYS
jgi:calpain, invertebrate